MRTTAFAVAATVALGAPAAFAGAPFEDYGRVTNVTPEYDRVNIPHQECYSDYEPQARRRHDSIAGPLIGGVAGGLLGAQVGRGAGRVVASAAGAVVGALVGDHLGNRGREEVYEREVRRCRTVDSWEERVSGYRVSYEYQGRGYTAVLPYDPGERIPVHVSVQPAADGYRAY